MTNKLTLLITIPILLVLSLSVLSQELDQEFLDSLPEEISEDLKEQIKAKEVAEGPQYRRASTYVEKPDEIKSNRFGLKIFSMMQTSLMPINEPNLDSSYILDFGDELEIQFIGQKSEKIREIVNRDGSINLEDIGKVYLSGLSLDNAFNLIKTKVSEAYIGVDVNISLVSIRDIQIIVAGSVFNPGPYTLNGNSNIFHALSVSGGPLLGGSYRDIDLIRDNKVIENVDLYETFIYGKSNYKTRLQSGDIIFVNPVNNVISIQGAVKRPGEYELLENEKLVSLFNFSNGFSASADKSYIVLNRILDGKFKSLRLQNISQLDDIDNKDGDQIFIRSYPFRSVSVEGAVFNPGQYLMNAGDSINDLIEKAGGYTDNAYKFGAIYENKEAEEVNMLAVESLYEEFLDGILRFAQETSAEVDLLPLVELANQIRTAEPNGRIIIDLEDTSTQVLLKDEDSLFIPEYTNQIYMYGEIFSEGALKYVEKFTLKDYINKVGGLTESADEEKIYILHPNGETFLLNPSRNIFSNQPKHQEILPGSIIFVPKKVENRLAARLAAQSYAAILGSIGVSLASLSVLKD
jgi:polysaccharide export outer membrane protein